MSSPLLDGSLESWPDLAPCFSEAVLLCGNGLSVNIWAPFAYGSLFDYARDEGLTVEDLALFSGTENFERVLSDLDTAIQSTRSSGSLQAGSMSDIAASSAAWVTLSVPFI
jgi:hypothetical protein